MNQPQSSEHRGPREHRTRVIGGRRAKAVAGLGGGVLLAGSLVGLALLNPEAVPGGDAASPHELLEDRGFAHVRNGSPWRIPKEHADTSFEIDRSGKNPFGRLRGTIVQDVPLPPTNGVAMRFSVRIRTGAAPGAGAPKPVTVRAQTACASGEEVATDAEVPGTTWRAVSVLLLPRTSSGCSMRVGIESTEPVEIDDASYTVDVLAEPSFEAASAAWQITNGSNGSSFAIVASDTAEEGKSVGRFRVGSSPTSLLQDLVLDRSSEATLASASIAVRSPDQPTTVELRISSSCLPMTGTTKATVGPDWQVLTVAQQRLAPIPGQLPPDPPDQIRPEGEPCRQRVELASLDTDRVLEVDEGYLDLRSYNPADGSARYKRSIAEFVRNRRQIEEDAAEAAAANADQSSSAVSVSP